MKKGQVSKSFLRWLAIFRKSPVFLIILFILGIFIGSNIKLQLISLIASGVFCLLIVLSIFVFKNKSFAGYILVFILGLSYFWFYQSLEKPNIPQGCTNVRICSNVAVKNTKARFAIVDSDEQRAVISTGKAETFGYGDELRMCFEDKNASFIEEGYGKYLKSRYQTNYLIKDPEVEVTSRGEGTIRGLFDLSLYLSREIKELFPGDKGVLAKGLLFGGSEDFTSRFQQNLKNSGTSHLVAVSGYNVSIITIILFGFLRNLFSRRFAAASTLGLLICFCVMTGVSASVVRASIMGFLYVVAKIIGRRGAIANSLFVAAFAMIILNPYSIWDVGFQLSFAATLGLVLLEEPLRILLFGRFFKMTQGEVISSLTATLSAQLFTLPILLFSFGQISAIAPLANVLILPIVPWAMLFVAIALAAKLLWGVLGLFLAGFTQMLLEYFISVIRIFGRFELSVLTIENFGWVGTLLLYILIALAVVFIKQKAKNKLRSYVNEAKI